MAMFFEHVLASCRACPAPFDDGAGLRTLRMRAHDTAILDDVRWLAQVVSSLPALPRGVPAIADSSQREVVQ